MDVVEYKMPESLGMPEILNTCREIYDLPSAEEYEVDFSRIQHFEPFGMLMLGYAIRSLGERDIGGGMKPVVLRRGKDLSKQGHDYAHRLGFWRSIGDTYDLPSVKKTASDTTIPITQLSYAEMYHKAGGRDPIRADIVGKAAAELATTLTGSAEKTFLWDALEYCFREMIRNAFEHGRTDSIWYAGATRGTKDDVQIAIIDGGRGIRASLADNPHQQYATDEEAIRAALRPGVSRNKGKVRSPQETEKLMEAFPGQDLSFYDNCGYGLTLTSQLAAEAGQFAIASGFHSVAYVDNREIISPTYHGGTAVRVVLYPSQVEVAVNRVLPRGQVGKPQSASRLSASEMVRLGLTSH